MTVLLGPADADHFRVKVGRYGDRWYHDPLPGCDIAPACDTAWPSISTCKKASGSDWSFVALKRVAAALEVDTERLRGLDYGGRYDTLKSINQRGLEAAGQRGTNVHLHCEAKLRGYGSLLIPDGAPGTNYFPAVDAFFDTYQPELVAAEYVTINRALNGVGYGGTPDAIVRIDGKLWAIDWKSRGEDSEHGAYPEEAAQVAAGARADYMIVEGANGPERRPIPELDGGLIISIKPDGCRVYPIDLDKAWGHWCALHAWWVARLTEREPVGKPWAPKKTKPTPAEQVRALATEPDEGEPADLAAFTALERHYEKLPDAAKQWIAGLASEAIQHGVSFHARDHKTVRRFEIVRGLVHLAEHDPDNETLRAVAATVVGDVAHFPAVTAGHVIGSLTADEAAIFARRVDELITTPVPATVDSDGHVRFQFTDLAA